GMIATVASLTTMLFGASGVFGQLQAALNQIWGVTAGRVRGVRGLVRRRVTSFSLILGIGLLLFLSLVVSAVLAAVHQLLAAHLCALGTTLTALYLGRTGRTSVYGAAASLVVLLLWVYYSAQILLVGAEFTEVYSRRYGSRREEGS